MTVIIFCFVCFLLPLVAEGLDVPFYNTHVKDHKDTLVHLFEWKWTDIEKECEFLSKNGFGAVQVSSAQEHVMKTMKNDAGKLYMPSWIRSQAVSYSMAKSRGGTKEEFASMVKRCNEHGVRVIVDVIMNHMTALGLKYNGTRTYGSQRGEEELWTSNNSPFDATNGSESFPAVPYDHSDFNECRTRVRRFHYKNDSEVVRNCPLGPDQLLSLNKKKPNVQEKLVGHLNELVDLGVAGFRVIAAKHMWPEDILAIMNQVKNLMSEVFGENQRPFVLNEMIEKSDELIKASEYFETGRVTNFDYGMELSDAVAGMRSLKTFANFGEHWESWTSDNAVVFVDGGHDAYYRHKVLTHENGTMYDVAVAYMLAWPFGFPRVLSSFRDKSTVGTPNSGPPNYDITPVFGDDGECSPNTAWVCQHRHPIIRRMVAFRANAKGQPATVHTAEDNYIAFSRGENTFFALNSGESAWDATFTLTLQPGSYCDVISGEVDGQTCSGQTVTVQQGGSTTVTVPAGGAVAIHTGQRL